MLEDPTQSNPINGTAELFSVTFLVKNGVSAGSSVSATVQNIYVTTIDKKTSLGSASWSAKILAPLSGDAELDDLWCDNAELNFTGGTEYSITVPYSVSSLDLDWSRSHSGSSVSVSGNSLSVGSNTVTITVEAENGNTKRYYIYVTREQDPNYVPSTDATLSSLSLSTGTLSPAFSTDVTDYVVYVPYEVTKLEISAVASDSKAKGVSQTRKVLLPEELPTDDTPADGTAGQTGTAADGETPAPQYSVLSADDPLPEGETIYTVTCTAEDGTTTKDYTVHVIRMPLYAGVLPEIIPPVTEPVEPEPEPEPTTYDISLPLVLTLPYIGEVTLQQAALGALIALGVILLLLLLIAWAIGRRGGRKKALRKLAESGRQPDAPAEALLDRLAAEEAGEIPAVPVEEVSAADLSAEAAVQADETPCTEEAPAEEESIAEEPSAEEAPAPEEPVGEADPPCEEAVAAAAVLSAAEPADEEPADDTPTQETPDQPAASEEPAEEPSAEPSEEGGDAAPSSEQPADTPDELAGMSLDELLEDIRNM